MRVVLDTNILVSAFPHRSSQSFAPSFWPSSGTRLQKPMRPFEPSGPRRNSSRSLAASGQFRTIRTMISSSKPPRLAARTSSCPATVTCLRWDRPQACLSSRPGNSSIDLAAPAARRSEGTRPFLRHPGRCFRMFPNLLKGTLSAVTCQVVSAGVSGNPGETGATGESQDERDSRRESHAGTIHDDDLG